MEKREWKCQDSTHVDLSSIQRLPVPLFNYSAAGEYLASISAWKTSACKAYTLLRVELMALTSAILTVLFASTAFRCMRDSSKVRTKCLPCQFRAQQTAASKACTLLWIELMVCTAPTLTACMLRFQRISFDTGRKLCERQVTLSSIQRLLSNSSLRRELHTNFQTRVPC